MKRLLNLAFAALLVIGAGWFSAEAATAKEWNQTGTFTWLANGQVTVLEKDHYYWVGKFTGGIITTDPANPTYGASETCPGFNDIGRAAGGYCVITDSAGDMIYLTWQTDGGVPVSHGSFAYTGGTGKFDGASGGGDFDAYFSGVPFADGSQSGYSVFKDGAKLILH